MIAAIKHKIKRIKQKIYISFMYSDKERRLFRQLKQRQIRAGKNDYFKPKVKSTVNAGVVSYKDFYKHIKAI